MSNKAEQIIQHLLEKAGIQINGSNAYDIQVTDPRCYNRILNGGALGLGETYMDNCWDCANLDEFFYRISRANFKKIILNNKHFLYAIVAHKIRAFITQTFNFQTLSRAKQVATHHYDLGNNLFQAMLDKWMMYSCAYWENSSTLDEAQEAKLELICKKLQIKPGMRVLDIGCGWGGFAKYIAEKYQAQVVGVTISKEQADYAKQICEHLPVEIRLQDYREVNGKFDRICSIGMFEHVGHKNSRTFMQIASRCLTDDGLFLLHTIGANFSTTMINAWAEKYIFPNAHIPSLKQISQSAESIFIIEDVHNFGAHYDKTLMAWYDNFKQNWNTLKQHYDDRFYRMWKYYLLSSASAFRARKLQLWQIVLSKRGVLGGYQSIR